MEYMNIKGRVLLQPNVLIGRIDEDIINALGCIRFVNSEGIIASVIKRNILWILGEGLVCQQEANTLIAIARRIYAFSDHTCRVDVQRMRWKLNIVMTNEYSFSHPHNSESRFLEAR